MEQYLNYTQLDIVRIPFPYSDFSSSKQRPALIISNEKLNKGEDRICLMITSVPKSSKFEIKKENIEENEKELPFKSYIKTNRIITISKSKIIKKLTSINNEYYNKIIEDLCGNIVTKTDN